MPDMTSRERLLASLRGDPVDRVAWSPFLAYWWEHQPQAIQARGQVWFFREIGADALLRGFVTAFNSSDVHGLSAYPGFILPIPGVDFAGERQGGIGVLNMKHRLVPCEQWQETAQPGTRVLL
jgi:hypothetical protein